MTSASPVFPRARVERAIAATRVVLAATGLFAIWLDPAEPQRYVRLTYFVHAGYLAYAIALAALMWRRSSAGRLPLATHLADIAVFSVLQYLTLGPSSPFFVYFVFSLFAAAMRWGWRATIWTAGVVIVMFLVVAVSIRGTLGPTEFDLNRFVIRVVYLMVVAALLVYLGRHEARLRAGIERLARWPAAVPGEGSVTARHALEYASAIVGARHAVAVWGAPGERWVYVADWTPGGFALTERPADAGALTGPGIASARLVGMAADASSAPFGTARIDGRVWFEGMPERGDEIAGLVGVVARDIGASLDQLYLQERWRRMVVREDRIRLARDLHDGVLQSMTGIRFELQGMAGELEADARAALRDRLLAAERALAIEQRELRLFIEDLKPEAPAFAPGGGALAARLEEIRDRVSAEWKVPVTLRASDLPLSVAPEIEQAVPLMVHEAIVNALKHAHPSRVLVSLAGRDGRLVVTVSDDGRGFQFRGTFGQAELARMGAGPQSLRERVATLGGELTIESTASGSRVEWSLPTGAVHV